MAGDGHPRQMTIPGTRVPGTELGLRLDQRGPPDLVRRVAELRAPTRRHDGRSIFAAAALAALVTAATAQRAPVTARYRVDQTLTQDMDASAAGKGKQSISFSTSSFLTLTLTDSTGGRSVRVVVDSMRGDSAAPIPAAVFDSAKGAEFHAFLSAAGKLGELEAVNASPAALRVQGFLTDFFPVGQGGRQGRRAVGRHQRQGHDRRHRQRRRQAGHGLPGRRQGDPGLAEGAQGRERIHLDRGRHPAHAERARPHRRLRARAPAPTSSAPRASYLGGDWQLRSALTISGAFANEPLPITITQTTKVTALKMTRCGSARPPGALLAALLLAGCGGSTAGNAPTPAPAPHAGRSRGAGADARPGHGPAVTYKPVRNAAYRLERHDSLSLQYPGGATQEQVRDRIAFLRVTVTESPTPGAYQVADRARLAPGVRERAAGVARFGRRRAGHAVDRDAQRPPAASVRSRPTARGRSPMS